MVSLCTIIAVIGCGAVVISAAYVVDNIFLKVLDIGCGANVIDVVELLLKLGGKSILS